MISVMVVCPSMVSVLESEKKRKKNSTLFRIFNYHPLISRISRIGLIQRLETFIQFIRIEYMFDKHILSTQREDMAPAFSSWSKTTLQARLRVTRTQTVITSAVSVRSPRAETSPRNVDVLSKRRQCTSRAGIRRPGGRTAALSEEAAGVPIDVDMSVPAPDDPVIGVMFTLAVVSLSIVTLGVAYLSITSWLDSRQEEEDRRKSGFGPSGGASSDAGFNTSAFADNANNKRSKKKKSPKKKSEKGFGA